MEVLWWLFVVGPTFVWAALLVGTLRTLRHVPRLGELDPPALDEWPKLSLVCPARDEAAHVEAAMKANLSADYPNLEIVAVDDRSTDETGAILDRLAAEDPRLRVVHIREAREGWLGKLAALDAGVAEVSGRWLLFADADVSLAPGALARVVAYCEDRGLDYLTASPSLVSAGFLGDACYATMAVSMTGAGRLWAVADPNSDAVAGMGAFILFRKSLFDRTEGLEWLRLEVADDVGLGLLAKRAGARCAVVNGRGLIDLPWYSGVPEMFDKLQKNWVAILGRFSPLRLGLISMLVLWCTLSGLAAAFAPRPSWAPAAALAPALMIVTSWISGRWVGLRPWPTLFVPLGWLLMVAMMVYANVQAVRRGGIVWRGLVYRREDLAPHQRVRI